MPVISDADVDVVHALKTCMSRIHADMCNAAVESDYR
jgi:hypothetical protein